MRLLLDTHALLWWFAGDRRLTAKARAAMDDDANEVFVSAVSAYEITFKAMRGRLRNARAVSDDVTGAVKLDLFEELALSMADAERAGRLPPPIRDPFDRFLVAQALAGDYHFVSNEGSFDRYGVRRLW